MKIYAITQIVPDNVDSPFRFGYVSKHAYLTKEAAIARLKTEYDTIEETAITSPSTAWIAKCTITLFSDTFVDTFTVFEVEVEG